MTSSLIGDDGLRKGTWTVEEDFNLINYITEHGHANWSDIPKRAGLRRTGVSCRVRWTNYLRPDVRRGPFSNEEEAIIIDLHEVLGNRWSVIAQQLPGRTGNQIRNAWYTKLRKKLPIDPPYELFNDVGIYDLVQSNPPFAGQEMRLDLGNYMFEPEHVDTISFSSVKNYSTLQGKSSCPDEPRFGADRDSDFTDIDAFIGILRGNRR